MTETCPHGNPVGTDWGPCSLCDSSSADPKFLRLGKHAVHCRYDETEVYLLESEVMPEIARLRAALEKIGQGYDSEHHARWARKALAGEAT